MKSKKSRIFLIPLLAFLLVLQSVRLMGAGPQDMQMPMPGGEMPAMEDDSMKHDHSQHKVKEPVLMPTMEGMVKVGERKGELEAGRRIFKKHCVYCHGTKGLGDGPITIGLDAAPPAYFRENGILYMSDQDIFNIVSYGTKTSKEIQMPAWTGILTEEERLDVVAYIKDLAETTKLEMKEKGLYEKYAKAPGNVGKLQLHDHGMGHEMFHIHGAEDMGDMMLMKGVAPLSPLYMALIFVLTTIGTLAALVSFDKKGASKDKTSYPRLDLFRSRFIKRAFMARPFQFLLQLPIVLGFLLVIVTGFLGDQNPGRNFATLATWTIWWSAVIFMILFLGASWCLICPWSAISDWIERVSFWKRKEGIGLKHKWPQALKSRHIMTAFFIVVTWLELGIFITYSPRYTAFFALLLILLILATALVFTKKSFCRYVCFVGGIVGVYSNLAPVEVRSRDKKVCDDCKTKDCIRGNHKGYPCPIYEYPGGMDKNTNCILCTECLKTCPPENMSLNIRPFFTDLSRGYKGRYDEAILALTLLGLTIYHGFTMLPVWFSWALNAYKSNYFLYLGVFSLLLVAFVAVPVGLHYLISWLTKKLSGSREVPLKKVFVQYAYAFIPVAFFYHLAHNVSHLNMEGVKIIPVLSDPFGWGWNLFGTSGAKASVLIGMATIKDVQLALILLGLVVGIFLSYRISLRLFTEKRRAVKVMLPVVAAILGYSYINMLALIFPMVMRTVSYF
jgi:polyferredoxin/mono/diheme cytochrome c family protein